MPYRYTNEAHTEGGAKGKTVPTKPMVHEYYDIMGWDTKTGKPYSRTLEELGLPDVAEDLWSKTKVLIEPFVRMLLPGGRMSGRFSSV